MKETNHRYYLQTLNERGVPQTIDGFASRHLAKAVASKSQTEFIRNSRTGRVWSTLYNRWVLLETYASTEGFLSELAPTPFMKPALEAMGFALGLHILAGGHK